MVRPTHPLRELRDALQLSPTELADAIGRSRPFVVMVENGKTSLGRESVLALFDRYRDALNRLGITAEDLLRGSRERAPVELKAGPGGDAERVLRAAG